MKNLLTIFLILTCGLCFGQNNQSANVFDTVCDSIYGDKGYKINQTYFPEGIDTRTDHNCVFQFLRTIGTRQAIIYQDTVYSRTGEITFKDFNGDNIKDIMIQNISDVRSNRTYYLYLVDTANDRLKKIYGFEEIKNPNYLPHYDLIDNYVNSGRDWTSFYKIDGDRIKDYDIVIYDGHTDNGIYDSEYKSAIQTILKDEKINH